MLAIQKNITSLIRCERKILAVALLFVSWLIAFFPTIYSAAEIWYISEIFTHGFFIIPGTVYLLYRDRGAWLHLDAKSNYWVGLPILGCIFLYLLGEAASLAVFKHIAVFTILPLCAWFYLGNTIARKIWFPLAFVLFCIPIGEELVPALQQVTADIAVYFLNLTNIPIFRTGLYIDIPGGRFVVAEACSGIRFFVGSIVFGAIYSYLTYRSLTRQALFMVLAVVVPIIANAIRVFGIILIGHYSDMEYATGADHIIYGWVFFAIVLFLLVVVGEQFKEKAVGDGKDIETKTAYKNPQIHNSQLNKKGLLLILALLGLTAVWESFVVNSAMSAGRALNLESLASISRKSLVSDGLFQFTGYTDQYVGKINASQNSSSAVLYINWYANNTPDAELISSSNRVFDIDKWSIVSRRELAVATDELALTFNLIEITAGYGKRKYIAYWYQFNQQSFSNKYVAKLAQGVNGLIGKSQAGAVIGIAIDAVSLDAADTALKELVAGNAATITQALPFN